MNKNKKSSIEIVEEITNLNNEVKATKWKPLFNEDYLYIYDFIKGKNIYLVVNPISNKIIYTIGKIFLINMWLSLFLFGVFGILNYTFVADIFALLSFISTWIWLYCLAVFEY